MHPYIVAFSVRWQGGIRHFRDRASLHLSLLSEGLGEAGGGGGQWGRRSSHLHRVEPAVAVEREADDMCGVLVPASVDGVAHDVPGLWEDLLDEGLLAAERDPLTQVRCDPHHQAVTGPAAAPLLLLLLPALQLPHHGLQLVVARLLVQQAEVLREQQTGWREVGDCLFQCQEGLLSPFHRTVTPPPGHNVNRDDCAHCTDGENEAQVNVCKHKESSLVPWAATGVHLCQTP